jgi:hypothetical protein
MKIEDKILIASDFSQTPGARYREDGEFSGEQFLEELLLPKFTKAVENKYILFVDLDKVWGYPSSFVSGSFGKLSIQYGADVLLKHIEFKSEDNGFRLEKIIKEINKPSKK